MALEVPALAPVGLHHPGGRPAGRRAVPPHLGLLDQPVLSSGHHSIGGWNFLDQTHKTKSSSHLLDYKNMLTRPNALHPHYECKWVDYVVAGVRGVCHLVTNRYQAGSHPRAVEKSVDKSAVCRSTHIQIQNRVSRF